MPELLIAQFLQTDSLHIKTEGKVFHKKI